MANLSQLGRLEAWLYGLGAAFVGGGSGSVTSWLASMGIDPQHFNLGAGLHATLQLMGATFVVNGILAAMLYLKQSPLPALSGAEAQSPKAFRLAPRNTVVVSG